MLSCRVGLVVTTVHATLAVSAWAAAPAEPFLRRLPTGVFLQSSAQLSDSKTKAIAQELGGDIDRLTNSQLRVQGRRIQINVVTAHTAQDAKKIHAALGANKPPPYCFQRGKLVVEYVGKDVDEALAFKTSYELGLIEKPKQLTYRIEATLAAVDQADYMACNPLFQQFIALDRGGAQAEIAIKRLAKRFVFGDALVLRDSKLYDFPAQYRFAPEANAESNEHACVRYSFKHLPSRLGVPYVEASIQVSVNKDGVYHHQGVPSKNLTSTTPQWPADQDEVRALAQRITKGKKSNGAKAMAILEWLAPGTNLRYKGQTGSRWGTEKVLEQGYGHCWDFSDCFVTLARAADVPSRQVAGWLYGSSGHVWAEFYREGVGWQQVDPTGGGKLRCGIYHIGYFTSEDGEMPIVYLGIPKIEVVATQE